MAAISASCNTHYDERLPMTSSAPPELWTQPPLQLTPAYKKATKTKKTKKQKLLAKKKDSLKYKNSHMMMSIMMWIRLEVFHHLVIRAHI